MTSIAPRNTTTFTDSLPDSSDELEAVVREERKQLKASIEELGSAMRDKVDVRTQFREHPLAAVGVGLAAGIALGVLSNRVVNGRASSAHHKDKTRRDHSSRSNSSPGGFSKFAAAMMGMVGTRVAHLAEDTIRDALARRHSPVSERHSNGDRH